jgi:putative cell wall-binding protein
MTRLRCAALATATVALLLTGTTPAAASALSYNVSPASGPAGTTITVSSDDRCPDPPEGETFDGVAILVLDHPLETVVGSGQAIPAQDGSWTVDFPISQSARNGGYRVFAFCVSESNGEPDIYDGYEPIKDFLVTSPQGQSDPVLRIAGVDRIGTAIAASQDIFKTSNVLENVVLSRADSYADALAGTPLADGMDGPLLLTPTGQLDPRTEQEIKRLLASGGTVSLLGGTAAISDAVMTTLQSDGYTVNRIAGVNRYDTATKVADAIASGSGNLTTVLIANGNDFHDGLIAGSAALNASNPGGLSVAGGNGGAVLLTNGETMAPETKSWLDAHGGVTRYAIGAVASKAAPAAVAIAGSDYADTSRKVAEQFYTSPAAVTFASSANFPDALTGGAHAAAFDAPLLFTDPASLPSTINAYLTGLKSAISIGFMYGGTAAISENVRTAAVAAIT